MHQVKISEILQWTDADLVGILGPDIAPEAVVTDSRSVAEGDLFIALRGERFDGHDFVEAAFERGASAALVERSWDGAGRSLSGPLLAVDSTLLALGAMAHAYRRRYDLPVVAVVGSVGKTTTKELIAAVLGQRYQVLKTVGSENNEIGVPRTLLQLSPNHEAVVLELAARRVGDIEYLCSIAEPTVGVLLNIGTAHLEYFESVEGVAKAKGELLDYLGESLTALVNADDRVVVQEVQRTKGRLLTFGFVRESGFRGEGLVLDQEGCGHFLLHNNPIELKIPGRHNAYNGLAAASIGRILDVDWEDIQHALAQFEPVSMRAEIVRKDGLVVINDCYNANPDSMLAALELLGDVPGARKIAFLGDMLELGPQSGDLHAAVGVEVATKADILLATGKQSKELVAAARSAGMDETQARHFDNLDLAGEFIAANLCRGDVVLVKASRAMAFDRIVERILQ
ncbi:MAG: UDP-N-acetylmuramoyl-tripeptide--D-alanyl-D-alanine ligase [Gemmatimonadetes bacterium]|jgi:UDP-N-acetylmuramoyl-tripeptide--D-alanyl-D-alanine ligase|nr:UDP-N-acetylmuramoyl-tripeptide--D-alanyl-D-alanine ligase [Gemmatimonadota bacterium]MBT5330137.1 UDP-N-acetylmuramoyl-tripeptide--D-alanyl-D-alanine ligase [Gemmatimonadota bacterium]MBT5450891.1 UDP-N-acetylmuramoyl-tripeptide--D-alanyl-D-alanine ligase [Gemmatimonadota bacterium]MBT5802367.1 UDP-N-acetylmuramoyl-tripeptide--D-alanyl-D-alanine ligase [Gemmatimonadota bacterium]MBT6619304.1 UDP-N-acetylmuramoyl-tripeptide--D-alanyl-D-alanine ligase [Gemmatimonadota bacterium]